MDSLWKQLSWLQSLQAVVMVTVLASSCHGYSPWKQLAWLQSLEAVVMVTVIGSSCHDINCFHRAYS